jgi:hypothetical protein
VSGRKRGHMTRMAAAIFKPTTSTLFVRRILHACIVVAVTLALLAAFVRIELHIRRSLERHAPQNTEIEDAQ